MKEGVIAVACVVGLALVVVGLGWLSGRSVDWDARATRVEDFEKRNGIARADECDDRIGFSRCSGVLSGRPVRYICNNDRCWWDDHD